jgi:transposase
MAKAYSADMRQRVLKRVESGASRREAAEHYDVSPSTAVIWVKCFRESAAVPPNRVAGAHRRWRSTRTFCWR